MSSDVSSTRLYLGNLPRSATKADVETHFAQHGSGTIKEVKLMNGFGFIEYEDEQDARDVVPAFHGTQFMGERLVVQFAKGARREPFPQQERPPPRPRRTPYRMTITALSADTSWQDLKDFARQSGLDVVYSEVNRERDGRGFVEYETMADLKSAVEKLDNHDFKGATVHCISDPQDERTFARDMRDRHRSRSPGPPRRGGYPPGPAEDYEYRGRPSRGYSPRRDDYRRRTPPRYYDDRYGRSPPRGGPRGPMDDYGPPRPRYPDDAYGPPPPRRGPYEDPYANGHGHGHGHGRPPYGGAPSPRRRSPPGRPAYDGYERPRYW